MPYTSPIESAQQQLVNLLAFWDWTNYFPSDYDATLVKGVQLTTNWPSDQQSNIETQANGMLVKPIVSVIALGAHVPPDGTVLGDILGPGLSNPALLQRGQTWLIPFQIDCWADLQTGAGDQVMRLGGAVMDCLLQNRNTLTSYRRLQVIPGGRPTFDEAGQLWRFSLDVEGRAVQSYDA